MPHVEKGCISGQPQDVPAVALVGDSLVEYFPIDELYQGPVRLYNRGVAGDTTYDILARLDGAVASLRPDTVIILAGVNDLMPFVPHNTKEEIVSRIVEIGKRTVAAMPGVRICVQSLYPVHEADGQGLLNAAGNAAIRAINRLLREQCIANGFTYIDVHSHLLDNAGQLDAHLTLDGLHVNRGAYEIILELLRPYFANVGDEPVT
ncbi:GDSL-type esterase/lipase family protein [Ethanoligenens harbinense]|uniref:Lipolytic protein G-D-S-L family n=1 Tax=Ethanoligenens harbinense (strain DSM 18485 / JCM 12961 / CGMCC 1.5033 / YUAN-3) TaxID=663278 RepID=E6U2Y7_ETHHY|nr:GDSL-type esterase/lipase family protein [Ethanoligenens harbinense]ADU26354.1 lipolytic protein G-D-S-L family [Ethanoligenens harbinense YUAN-3]